MKILEFASNKAVQVTAILSMLTALTVGFNALHSNYASAEDLKSLSQVVISSQIAEYEEMIRDLEEEISILLSSNRDQAQEIRLSQLQQRRERYLQNLADIRASR